MIVHKYDKGHILLRCGRILFDNPHINNWDKVNCEDCLTLIDKTKNKGDE